MDAYKLAAHLITICSNSGSLWAGEKITFDKIYILKKLESLLENQGVQSIKISKKDEICCNAN